MHDIVKCSNDFSSSVIFLNDAENSIAAPPVNTRAMRYRSTEISTEFRITLSSQDTNFV